jgi:cell division protein FtsA
MKQRIVAGIDIGSENIKVCVIEEFEGRDGLAMRVLAATLVESSGLKNGYIVDKAELISRLQFAKQQTEHMTQMPLSTCFLSVAGVSLDEVRATGDTIVSRADQMVSELDMETVEINARSNAQAQFLNKHILHSIPIQYRLDNQIILGDPTAYRGSKLEADFLFITVVSSHYRNTVECVEAAGIDVIDCMAAPLACSYVTLSKEQKKKGCILANIGAETTSVVIYDEGTPISVKVFPIGSAHITDNLALQFKISLEDADRLKLGKLAGTMYSKKKIDEAVNAKLKEMFDYIDKHLKTIGRKSGLPAGIIFTGGGSATMGLTELAKTALGLPAKIAETQTPVDLKIKDQLWTVAHGLSLWGFTGETHIEMPGFSTTILKTISNLIKKFTP